MNNLLLYAIPAFIWGTTWYAIQLQVGSVSPIWSVCYRFFLAAFLLILFCIVRKDNLKYDLKTHIAMATQGLLIFSLTNILYYLSSGYLISGTVGLISASFLIINIINSRIIFKIPISLTVALSAVIGIIGIALVFNTELANIYPHHAINDTQKISGLWLCLAATLCASFGYMVSFYCQKQRIPILQNNAYGMLYGAIFTMILAVLLGQKPTISWSLPYMSSLLYLSIFGSMVAYGAYIKLLGNIGPGPAGYISLITPIIALIISSVFEGFQWHMMTIIGVILILMGNGLILYKPAASSDPGLRQ